MYIYCIVYVVYCSLYEYEALELFEGTAAGKKSMLVLGQKAASKNTKPHCLPDACLDFV